MNPTNQRPFGRFGSGVGVTTTLGACRKTSWGKPSGRGLFISKKLGGCFIDRLFIPCVPGLVYPRKSPGLPCVVAVNKKTEASSVLDHGQPTHVADAYLIGTYP
jgi:hypothetical protein